MQKSRFVLGMTELALDSELTNDQRQCLKTVKSAADNLLGIINDLLDFAKIEAGKLELDRADFSLRSSVGDTLRALAVRARSKGLGLNFSVGPPAKRSSTLCRLVDHGIEFHHASTGTAILLWRRFVHVAPVSPARTLAIGTRGLSGSGRGVHGHGFSHRFPVPESSLPGAPQDAPQSEL
jgi:hypothetical protein